MTTEARWIELDGAVNVRDVGGLPTTDGRTVRPGRLIRAAHLQRLTAADVHELVDRRGVHTVIDLRSEVEITSEGPAPLDRDPRVRVHHLSLWPEAGATTDVTAADDGPVVLPWQDDGTQVQERLTAVGSYLRYLADRPDSIVAALRLLGGSDGATVIHCAAGKDRTGVVVALALDAVAVERAAIVADYVRTGERLEEGLRHLAASRTYAGDVDLATPQRHMPLAGTMTGFFREVDTRYGGTARWLRSQGWTSDDDATLRRSLVGDDRRPDQR
jgi:protein-tyrosine phosphatase